MIALVVALTCGCSEEAPDVKPPAPEPERVVFPAALRAADDSVNVMLLAGMNACLGGDYDSFRLLWSATTEPIPRQRFEKHFKAVEKITVRALEKDPDAGREAYAVYAEVAFDAAQLPEQHELRADPKRRVILLIIREQDAWRMASAPKAVRAWLAKKVEGEGADGEGHDALLEPGDGGPGS